MKQHFPLYDENFKNVSLPTKIKTAIKGTVEGSQFIYRHNGADNHHKKI